MEVVRHEPHGWFLLADGDRHYLDVNCRLPLVDTSILLRLDDAEEAELHALGDVFVAYLAAKVAHWPSRYQARDVGGPEAHAATEAIVRWQAR